MQAATAGGEKGDGYLKMPLTDLTSQRLLVDH